MGDILKLLMLLFSTSEALNFTDLGSRGACRMPQLSLCADIVNYKVPAAIATQAATIEDNLMDYSSLSANEQRCFEPMKRALCKQVFPMCSEEKNSVSFAADPDCRTQIQAGCTADTVQQINLDVICSTNTIDLTGPTQSCRSLRDHTASPSQGLGKCSGPVDNNNGVHLSLQLSDWMYRHMEVFGAVVLVDVLSSFTQCFAEHWYYLCYYGECSGEERIRTRANREQCLAASMW